MGRRRRFARAASTDPRRLRLEPLEERRLLAITVTTNLDVVDFNDGVLSLREAIFAANTVAGADTIEFDFGHDGPETIVLTQGELAITDSLSISGAGTGLLTIDASGNDLTPDQNNGDGSRVFNISDGNSATLIDVTIEGLTITGGDVTGRGGALLNTERTGLLGVRIHANAATSAGGAIRHEGGALVVTGSEVSANHAASTGVGGGGGGLSVLGGTGVEIVDSTVAENSSSTGGGIEIFASGGDVVIRDSHIDRNWTVSGGSGGIWASTGPGLQIIRSTVDGNVSAGRGGGVEVLRVSNFLLEDSSVSGNRANGQWFNSAGGGGIVFDGSSAIGTRSLEIRGSRIANNSALFEGGGISLAATSRLKIVESEIVGNTSERSGGGIFAVSSQFVVTNSIIAENHATAGLGGGIYGGSSVNLQVLQTLVRGNTSSDGGGGVAIVSGQSGTSTASALLVRDSMVTGNATPVGGGGISLAGGTHAVVNSTIAGNSAGGGGGISTGNSTSTTTELVQVTISGNQATHSGGGVSSSGTGLKISRSTIASNVADSDGNGSGVGGGIYDISSIAGMSIDQSILGDNRKFNAADDYYKSSASQLRYSLVEKFSSSTGVGGIGNSVGADPKLAPLADNGGPIFLDGSRMLTHALLAGSPAIDAGDPSGTTTLSLTYRTEVAFGIPSAYFRFEETPGTNFTSEIADNGTLTGVYNGVPVWGASGIVPGTNAVSLDGINDYLTVNAPSSLGFANTIEIWARSATEQWNASDWLARSNDAALFALNPIKNSKAWSAVVHGQVIGTFTPDATVDIREWHQYALSWDNTTGVAKMYFDGVEVASLTLALPLPFVSGTSIVLGRNNGSSSPQFGKGAIDEFAIYERVLSAEELLAHTRVARMADYDQRGETFTRIIDGDGIGGARIDIGAVEAPQGETYTLVVDSLVDENDGDHSAGDFSLREALAVTNANIGAATIEFAPELTAGGPARILLTQGELVVSGSTVINGPGAHLLTIDASGNDPTPASTLGDGVATNDGDGSRVLNVDDGTGANRNVEIRGLRVTGGDVTSVGGGILARENLVLRECIVDDNISSAEGGGIYSGTGTLSSNSLVIIDSAIARNQTGNEGGGVRKVIGELTVERTVIDGNYSGRVGGGISAANELVKVVIRDSVIKKNRATRSGSFGGGGVFLFDAIATILSSSVVENQADFGGGIHAVQSSSGLTATKISNSTVSNNTGGGISLQGQGDISHSSIINNAVQGSGARVYSTIIAGASASSINDFAYNIILSSSANLVGPLFGSGEHVFIDGSLMPTHVSLPHNSVIDAGNPLDLAGIGSVPEFDQRGAPFGRVVQGRTPGIVRIDIGAYERRADEVLSFVVDTLEDDDGDDFSPGDRSLREVIELANAVTGVQTITFHPDLLAAGAGEILLKFGEIAITEALNIDGPGAELLTVNAQQLSRVFNITAETGNFVIEGLTLAHGKTTAASNLTGSPQHVGSGGAIRSMTTGTLAINETTVRDSMTMGSLAWGGGIFAAGPLTLNRSLVSGNSTAGNGASGGGVAAFKTVTVTDSTVHGNRVLAEDESGGGVWSVGNATITRSVISANELAAGTTLTLPPGGGGGVASQSGAIFVTDSVVRDNVAQGSVAGGGGVRAISGGVVVTRSLISGNQAAGNGGGVLGQQRVDVIDSTISNNMAVGSGGGVYCSSEVVVTNSTVSGNSTTGTGARGGGIGGRSSVIQWSTVTKNRTSGIDAHGGGVAATSSTTARGSIVAANTAGSGQGDDSFGNSNLFFTLLGNNLGATGSFVAEAPVGSPDARGNLIGGPVNGVIDPLLGPLANNGGPTLPDGSRVLTHALLPGSPAINSGDPAAVAGVNGVPTFDQRGTPWSRVVGGRIDMGAVEWQSNPLVGDYNFNGVVDAADYSVWMDTLGSTDDLRADGDGDGSVDADDYDVWKMHFGEVLQQGAGSTEQGGSGALAASQRLAEEGDAGSLSVFAVLEESTRNEKSRRAVRSRLFAHALATEVGGDLLMTTLSRRAKYVDEVAEIEFDHEDEIECAAVDEVFALVDARRGRLS